MVFLPNRPVIADKVMIGRAFRNASFDGGKVTLWVTSDRLTVVSMSPLIPR